MYPSLLLIFFSCRRLKNEHGQVKLFLFAMAMTAVFFVGVNARVAAHYNNHKVSCHSGFKMVEIFTD